MVRTASTNSVLVRLSGNPINRFIPTVLDVDTVSQFIPPSKISNREDYAFSSILAADVGMNPKDVVDRILTVENYRFLFRNESDANNASKDGTSIQRTINGILYYIPSDNQNVIIPDGDRDGIEDLFDDTITDFILQDVFNTIGTFIKIEDPTWTVGVVEDPTWEVGVGANKDIIMQINTERIVTTGTHVSSKTRVYTNPDNKWIVYQSYDGTTLTLDWVYNQNLMLAFAYDAVELKKASSDNLFREYVSASYIGYEIDNALTLTAGNQPFISFGPITG